jgi:hypothetical protein
VKATNEMWKFGIGTRKWTLEVSKVISHDRRIKQNYLTSEFKIIHATSLVFFYDATLVIVIGD